MRLAIEARLEYRLHAPADLLFAVEVAQLADQRLIEDSLTVFGTGPLTPIPGGDGVGQRTWAHGAGNVRAIYTAIVDVDRMAAMIDALPADPLPKLPPDVVPYLMPSRYCGSDRFEAWVKRRFGHLSGGATIAAIMAWVAREISYGAGTTSGRTTAADSFVQREGVCRDFAHLLIAMARAADIPARMVGAYGLGVQPPDFHAVAEVWLDGAWHLVDPTGLAPVEAIVKVCVGRDATDVSFLTIFGTADFVAQDVSVRRMG